MCDIYSIIGEWEGDKDWKNHSKFQTLFDKDNS